MEEEAGEREDGTHTVTEAEGYRSGRQNAHGYGMMGYQSFNG